MPSSLIVSNFILKHGKCKQSFCTFLLSKLILLVNTSEIVPEGSVLYLERRSGFHPVWSHGAVCHPRGVHVNIPPGQYDLCLARLHGLQLHSVAGRSAPYWLTEIHTAEKHQNCTKKSFRHSSESLASWIHNLHKRCNREILFWGKQHLPYLNIVTTSLRIVKSLEGIWFSWISQTEGTPGHFSISEGETIIFSPSSASTWTGNSLFQDHILLDSTNWA